MSAKKRKKILIILLIVVLGIVSLNFYLINNNPLSFSVKDLMKIEIQNGTNGKLMVLENDSAKKLSDELVRLDVKLTGINGWTSGYKYKVKIITSNNSKEIVIKSKNGFVRGIFKYETEKDIIKLIEDMIIE